MNPIPDEEGGNLYLINGNLTKLKDAGLFGQPAGGNDNEDRILVLNGEISNEEVL